MRYARTSGAPLAAGLIAAMLLAPGAIRAEAQVVDFGSERWITTDARVVDHLDRKALIGTAYLEDVDLGDGAVEVDVAVDGRRSYPGIIFRMRSDGDYEHIYIRPHRAGFYSDAIQYTPVMNGVSSWQLYNGEGYTAVLTPAVNRWVRLRIEFAGKQARVYFGEAETPVLVVTDLKHGSGRGAVGLSGPTDGTAYFSNFRYEERDDLVFAPPPPVESPPGLFTEWELSQTFRLEDVDTGRYPDEETLSSVEWRAARSDRTGLVDVARHHPRSGSRPDVVFARAVIQAEHGGVRKLLFGYSDAISICVNGRIVFTGNSAYRQRDPSFLGIVGLNDAVYLPLAEGKNELFIMVAEAFGGWGFIFQDGEAVFMRGGVAALWETGRDFDTPEAVLFDPQRNAIYVSNFGSFGGAAAQYVSRLRPDGEVENLRWIEGLANPTGMALAGERLYIVERSSVVEVDAGTGGVLARHAIPQPGFVNDIAVDAAGAIYVSDTRKGVIFRFSGGNWDEWASGAEINRPNGICIDDDRLIVGNGGDYTLRAIDLETKRMTTIALLAPGNIDGISIDRNGDYLVSHWEGRLYRVGRSGEVVKLLDTSVSGRNIADFGYRPDAGSVIVPTFSERRVAAYRIE